MKRDILTFKRKFHIDGCCPGHDDFPSDTYKNKRSKKARAYGKQIEHQYVRSHFRDELNKEVKNLATDVLAVVDN